jgi:pimeloyl-CoA synthetase
MNKLNCDTSEYTNPLGGKVKALEKETTGLKTSLAIVTDTVSQLIADKAASASLAHANLAQKVIDSANTKTENMSFGEALEAVMDGERIARLGWNGENQYVFLIAGMELNEFLIKNKLGSFTTGALAIKTSDDVVQIGWVANQTDMLARDWYIA